MLEVCMLGSLDARRDGVPLERLHSRRANRLFALLLLENNRHISRDWIEHVLDISYDGLRKAESALRSCLGPDRSRIKVGHNSLYIDVRDMTVDVFEFEKHVALGDETSLLKAIRLYRGGLLKDWESGWILERREELQLCYLDSLQTLIKLAIKNREYEKASSLLRRFTHVYPNVDFAWGQLIEVYRMAGQVEAANLAYAAYLAALEARGKQEQRAIPPSQRVADALTFLNVDNLGNVSNAVVSTASARVDIHFEPVGGAVPLSSPYYIRRNSDDLASTALAPQTSFILVKGARQVGKTSLLARLLQRGRDQSASVMLTDLQNIAQSDIESSHVFLLRVAESIVDQLGIDTAPGDWFDPDFHATVNFERFMLRHGTTGVLSIRVPIGSA